MNANLRHRLAKQSHFLLVGAAASAHQNEIGDQIRDRAELYLEQARHWSRGAVDLLPEGCQWLVHAVRLRHALDDRVQPLNVFDRPIERLEFGGAGAVDLGSHVTRWERGDGRLETNCSRLITTDLDGTGHFPDKNRL